MIKLRMEQPVSIQRANYSLQKFIALVKRLADEEKLHYNLIIGPANSGISMVYLYDIVLSALKINKPSYLFLPIFRPESPLYESGTDISHNNLLSSVKDLISKLPKGLKVLFLDDEIGAGTAAHTALDLLVDAAKITGSKIEKFTIIAEDLVFQNTYRKDVAVDFIPISKHPLDGVYNVISGLVPHDLSEAIQSEFQGHKLRRTEVFNIALGVPIKVLVNNVPQLITMQLSEELEGKSKAFRDELESRIKEYLKNYT